jgi:hypothetical protein
MCRASAARASFSWTTFCAAGPTARRWSSLFGFSGLACRPNFPAG